MIKEKFTSRFMDNEKTVKRIKKAAEHLMQFMVFSEDEIENALVYYDDDIGEYSDYAFSGIYAVCDDVIIFGSLDGFMEGVNVRTKDYLNYDECYDLIHKNKQFKKIEEVEP